MRGKLAGQRSGGAASCGILEEADGGIEEPGVGRDTRRDWVEREEINALRIFGLLRLPPALPASSNKAMLDLGRPIHTLPHSQD